METSHPGFCALARGDEACLPKHFIKRAGSSLSILVNEFIECSNRYDYPGLEEVTQSLCSFGMT